VFHSFAKIRPISSTSTNIQPVTTEHHSMFDTTFSKDYSSHEA